MTAPTCSHDGHVLADCQTGECVLCVIRQDVLARRDVEDDWLDRLIEAPETENEMPRTEAP